MKKYTVRIRCHNCGYENKISINQGQRVKETACPNCACLELERANLC